ncbi:hypothetical protein HYFRA_00009830 [Hymenoscyphus fraxineus]|uniref:Uncharacterized protein n=1 Tax=Hymenoscyphus fraxineus TaxID=746836 RepID=A0A9N9L6A1_9HELO|nr:hypothetical protein HYFRA_00009830 [Hymenoscyphus fraxineus]
MPPIPEQHPPYLLVSQSLSSLILFCYQNLRATTKRPPTTKKPLPNTSSPPDFPPTLPSTKRAQLHALHRRSTSGNGTPKSRRVVATFTFTFTSPS